MRPMIRYINNEILKLAKPIRHEVKDNAPSSFGDLIAEPGLKIWFGASDSTIFQDAWVNWAFRAVHDNMHHKTGLRFSPEHEMELGKVQAAVLGARCQGLLADLFYCEIAEQAKFYAETGSFLDDQVRFTLEVLSGLGYDVEG